MYVCVEKGSTQHFHDMGTDANMLSAHARSHARARVHAPIHACTHPRTLALSALFARFLLRKDAAGPFELVSNMPVRSFKEQDKTLAEVELQGQILLIVQPI